MTSSAVHQLLFLISLFLLMNSTYYVQSLDVVETTTMSESAGTTASSASTSSTTTSSIARSLWDSWTTSNGNNVRTNPPAPAPAPAPVDAPKCQLCHDGSFPKNKYHGVGTYHRSNDRYNHPLCASDRQPNTHIIQTLTRFCFSPIYFRF